MAVSKNILGMNARNYLYIRRYNRPSAKRAADNKLTTKQLMLSSDLPTPALLGAFYAREDIRSFDWKLPETGFAIKPARGYGGEGIIAFKQWKDDKGLTVSGETYTQKQLESHILDILQGGYSLQFLPDQCFIEERIEPHPFFRKLAPIGLPDIRIVVFQRVPVMAYMRLPTQESKGKANQSAGGLGVGIDLRTGITTYATYHKTKLISYIPGTKIKTSGIKIPDWDDLLLLAAKAQDASGLGYAGVDLVIDRRYGPMVLEINARPGLSIQIANLTSLRTRLERVEDMGVVTPERGVEVAKSLFAEKFSEKVSLSPKVLTVIQPVTIYRNGDAKQIEAKLDTGAYRTSVDSQLAADLGLPPSDKKVYVKSASGRAHRATVKMTFELAGKKINSVASVVDRSHLRYPMIVGRLDLKGFLISPEMPAEEGEVEEDE